MTVNNASSFDFLEMKVMKRLWQSGVIGRGICGKAPTLDFSLVPSEVNTFSVSRSLKGKRKDACVLGPGQLDSYPF